MGSQLVAVVVPIYKYTPNENESISLRQCIKVLGKYPIIFIAPENLKTINYENICKDHGLSFKPLRFDNKYFRNIEGYNQLMLSAQFYKKFLRYKYILIHQLDAYVFHDELEYWCEQKYDFIGAPTSAHENNANEMQFLKNYEKLLFNINKIVNTNFKISNVGNGGFSLRKTRTFYWLLKLIRKRVIAWGANNEDGFFKYWGNVLKPVFSLPTDEVAIRFSIEQYPKLALSGLNNKLPFGCHAFEKYEPETWKRFINFSIQSNNT